MDERYPSNSLTNRKAPEKPEEGKTKIPEVKPVISGTAKVKKKSLGKKFSDTFLVSDIKSVFSEMIFEVAIPAIKDAISELIRGTVDGMLYGDSYRRRSSKKEGAGRPWTSYRDPFEEKERRKDRARDERSRYVSPSLVDDIFYETKDDAERVRRSMECKIDEYQLATVKDLYIFSRMKSDFTMEKYGWYDFSDATINRVPGGWVLCVPKPKIIE